MVVDGKLCKNSVLELAMASIVPTIFTNLTISLLYFRQIFCRTQVITFQK
jgi:hypothetical protein